MFMDKVILKPRSSYSLNIPGQVHIAGQDYVFDYKSSLQLGEISKHEAYNRALKHPQLKCQEASEMVFDNKFCAAFKLSEHAVINKLEAALSQQVRIDMILINVDED